MPVTLPRRSIWVIYIASHLIASSRDASMRKNIMAVRQALGSGVRGRGLGA